MSIPTHWSEGVTHNPPPLPLIATPIAFAGGVVAQMSPTTGVGVAGLVASITALLAAGFQYYKAYLDAKQQAAKINDLEERLQKESETNTTKRHALRNHFEGQVKNLQADLLEEKAEAMTLRIQLARLQGQLGVVDHDHSEAINATAKAVQKVADEQTPPVSVDVPHVEPTTPSVPPSGDSYLGPNPLRN